MHTPFPRMSSSTPEPRPALVLIADDQEWMSRSIESILQPNGFAVLRAFTGRQCLALAERAEPDAVILNLHLPDMDGLDVLRALRSVPNGDRMPRLAFSWDVAGRAERLRALEAGAWAVYTQPLDADLFISQLRTFVAAHRSVDTATDFGLLDPASGLYNARGLARRAREVGAEAQRRREPLTCVAFAPEVSGIESRLVEEVLERTVQRLVEIVSRAGRVSDVIGRLGRTEFAAVLPSTEAEGAVRLIERLQEALAHEELGALARPSAGIAAPRLRAGYASVADFSDAASDPVELLLRAAAAMRHARTSGPGQAIRSYDDLPTAFPH